MRPLILEFAETPTTVANDYSIIEYSKKLNLSVLKGSEFPAIAHGTLDTNTVTKTGEEVSDPDDDFRTSLSALLDTTTGTFDSLETSDSDDDLQMLHRLMDTQTITESVEETDNDDDSSYYS